MSTKFTKVKKTLTVPNFVPNPHVDPKVNAMHRGAALATQFQQLPDRKMRTHYLGRLQEIGKKVESLSATELNNALEGIEAEFTTEMAHLFFKPEEKELEDPWAKPSAKEVAKGAARIAGGVARVIYRAPIALGRGALNVLDQLPDKLAQGATEVRDYAKEQFSNTKAAS